MNNSTNKTSAYTAVVLIALAAASRLLTMLPNFSATEAIALFGGAFLISRIWVFLTPILALYLSDLVINNTVARVYFTESDGIVWFSDYMIGTFVSVILIALLGMYVLRPKISIARIGCASIMGSLIFFFVTNTQSWFGSTIYTQDFSGLLQSLIAGLPFLKNSMLSSVLFSGILFGLHHMVSKWDQEASLLPEKV